MSKIKIIRFSDPELYAASLTARFVHNPSCADFRTLLLCPQYRFCKKSYDIILLLFYFHRLNFWKCVPAIVPYT